MDSPDWVKSIQKPIWGPPTAPPRQRHRHHLTESRLSGSVRECSSCWSCPGDRPARWTWDFLAIFTRLAFTRMQKLCLKTPMAATCGNLSKSDFVWMDAKIRHALVKNRWKSWKFEFLFQNDRPSSLAKNPTFPGQCRRRRRGRGDHIAERFLQSFGASEATARYALDEFPPHKLGVPQNHLKPSHILQFSYYPIVAPWGPERTCNFWNVLRIYENMS